MSIRPSNLPPVQDMPPPGGYRKVDLSRTMPTRGPKGWQIWAGTALAVTYGFYRIGQTNKEANQQKMQERKIRYMLAPIMQAEADREWCERELVALRREAEIMKGVKGWVVGRSPYFTGKWMPKAIHTFDRAQK